MPKLEWGVKRTCPTTGKRFYDLNRSPVVSPYTGEVVDIEGIRRKGLLPEAKPVAKAKVDDLIEDEIEADDDLIAEDPADIEDDLLEDEDDDSVSLDDIADVGGEDE